MMRIPIPCLISTAAGTAVKANVLVPPTGMSYRLISIEEIPRIATAANGTNFVVRTVKIGANAVATAKSTATDAMAANTTSAFVGLSSDLSKTLITASAPLFVDVTHGGSGAQMAADYIAVVELVR